MLYRKIGVERWTLRVEHHDFQSRAALQAPSSCDAPVKTYDSTRQRSYGSHKNASHKAPSRSGLLGSRGCARERSDPVDERRAIPPGRVHHITPRSARDVTVSPTTR